MTTDTGLRERCSKFVGDSIADKRLIEEQLFEFVERELAELRNNFKHVSQSCSGLLKRAEAAEAENLELRGHYNELRRLHEPVADRDDMIRAGYAQALSRNVGMCEICKEPIIVMPNQKWKSKGDLVWHESCQLQKEIDSLRGKLAAAKLEEAEKWFPKLWGVVKWRHVASNPEGYVTNVVTDARHIAELSAAAGSIPIKDGL